MDKAKTFSELAQVFLVVLPEPLKQYRTDDPPIVLRVPAKAAGASRAWSAFDGARRFLDRR